ncbi:MAG: DUF3802 family protein [Pseudomonadota bacterium]|jgi:hypothetical protein|uniref:DUF3802 family protein n=1 Tax=Pseudoalteromonas spongiae TaxID=298657 RepID=A0ABU8EUA8_9GAMM|nr:MULTISPECIES: DUF3802 family protein [Pseudoalteromonas]ATC99716.1 hypothetical protein PSPO_a2824 [Pseudoalteromonas spongiae UST010723-006]MEC8327202.1 DUF3802 family protein [Pseudomonadota bacterium]TMO86055.1 DUF3802 domain-containing protein [Pseudoalteromonas spongiae]
MVIDQQGYDELIMYLTEHLSLFEKPGEVRPGAPTVMALIEDDIAEQIINFCMQHEDLSVDDRSVIMREVDGIVYDLQEVLSGVVNQPVTIEQHAFIDEFSGLVKNLFDSAVS